MAVLLVIGLKGAQEARLEGRIGNILAIRDELQQHLDMEQRPRELISFLKDRVLQFKGDYDPRKLSPEAGLSLREAQATVANAEQRFSDALAMVTEEDEKAHGANLRVLQERGDAFYGLREWENALDRYQKMISTQPKRLATLGRVADCQYASGKRAEAFATYREVMKQHKDRANEMIAEGKRDEAKRHLEKASQIEKWLTDQGQEVAPGPKAE